MGRLKPSVQLYRLRPSGAEPNAGLTWEFKFDASGMKRPKFTGYSVEIRYEEDGQNILLDEEYEDCDTAEELAERNEESQRFL